MVNCCSGVSKAVMALPDFRAAWFRTSSAPDFESMPAFMYCTTDAWTVMNQGSRGSSWAAGRPSSVSART